MPWHIVTQPKAHGGLGVRSARENNVAMLGKMVDNLLHDYHKPWVLAMSQRYLQFDLVLQGKCKNEDSYLWRSIMRAKYYVVGGFQPQLGNGSSSLWYSNWLDSGRLCDRIDFVHISDTTLTVASLWKDGSWNFDLLATILPPDLVAGISSVKVPHTCTVPYAIRWRHSPNGNYTPSSAYHSLTIVEEGGIGS